MFEIKVPATSANLGPGFDSLGIALKLYNTFYLNKTKNGINIKIIDKGTNEIIKLSKEKNLVYQAVKKVFNLLQEPLNGIEIIEKIEIPFARGLGSSATAILGGLVGANNLLGNPIEEEDLIKMAIEMEGHPDNLLPAYYGGFVINVLSNDKLIHKKISINKRLKIIMVIPEFELDTVELRKVLPEKIKFEDAVFNHSRTALLAASLYDDDWDKLTIAMKDRLHQDYRAKLIPGFNDVLKAALDGGAFGTALSGAGPSILAFSLKNEDLIGNEMVRVFKENNINSRYIVTEPDNNGIIINRKEERID